MKMIKRIYGDFLRLIPVAIGIFIWTVIVIGHTSSLGGDPNIYQEAMYMTVWWIVGWMIGSVLFAIIDKVFK